MSLFHPVFVSFLLSIMLTPVHICDALTASVFHPVDTACTGRVPAGVINRDRETSASPDHIGPLLPGYCYPNIYFSFEYYTKYSYTSSIIAYCDPNGTAHITSYQDDHCTKPDITTATSTTTATVAGAEGTCLSMRIFKNYTYTIENTTMNIIINCTHQLPARPTVPGPYMNVSAIYYDSSPTCNSNDSSTSPSSSPSLQYHLPPGPNFDACVTVDGLGSSFRIGCRYHPKLHIYSDQKCSDIHTTIGIGRDNIYDTTYYDNTTCATDEYYKPINSTSTRFAISAHIDCGTVPNNGQPKLYPTSNHTYIVTGINYQQRYRDVYECNKYLTPQTSFGPFEAGKCQGFASNMSSYMVTCSDDGQARINVFHGTTTCDTKQFFSFAQGTADGKTCIPFSMANGDEMFQYQTITILCKIPSQPTNSSPLFYHHIHTYMVLLCVLFICINAFASI